MMSNTFSCAYLPSNTFCWRMCSNILPTFAFILNWVACRLLIKLWEFFTDTSSLSDICFANIFSKSGACLYFLKRLLMRKRLYFFKFVYLFMAAAGLRCCVFSPVVASSGSFLLRWVGLSLQRLLLSWSAGSPGPGIGPVSLRFTSGFFTTELQGKPKSL